MSILAAGVTQQVVLYVPTLIGLQGSYNIPVITFYGGLGLESSSIDVQYTFTGESDLPGSQTEEATKFDINTVFQLSKNIFSLSGLWDIYWYIYS